MSVWNKLDKAYIWHPFSPLAGADPIFVKKGRGVYLHTDDGHRIIDGISSWWVNIHGHAHPAITRAIAKQAKTLEQVIFAGFTHQPAIQLAQLLMKILPDNQGKLFFSDDGSTAVEVALKLAIQYWHNQGIPRRRVIAIEGAYHGDTFGSMSVGDRGVFNQPFFPYLFEVDFIPFPVGDGANSIEAMRQLATPETAAFIFEPLVQGAAGMRMYAPAVLDELLRIAKGQNALCIADEVMTGFGRTGKTFASYFLTEKPDFFCLSKGITGGYLPMGVTAVSAAVAAIFETADRSKIFYHGHSYTANPIACAAALASTRLLLSEKTQQAIARIGELHLGFAEKLKGHPKLESVQCTGTILSITLKTDDAGYTSRLREQIYGYFMAKNILLRPLGNVIYVLPPYVISDQELRKIYAAIEEFLETTLE